MEEAYEQITLAEELDPLSSIICLSAMFACMTMGRDTEARARLRKLSEIDPSSPLVNEGYMSYHFAMKEYDESMKYLQKMMEADPTDPYLKADLAFIYAVSGRKQEALEIMEIVKNEIKDSSGTKWSLLAFVHSAFDDMDEVFRCLEKALLAQEVFFGWYRSSPIFEEVRKDPRFNELLARTGLL
jgi:predicted Zn-dependent protease